MLTSCWLVVVDIYYMSLWTHRLLCSKVPMKVRLHGKRQAARLGHDMLQRDLLRGNNVYMVGSCCARLLHIIHVSAVSEVGFLQEKCSRQPVPRGNYKYKLKMPPGLAAVAGLLRAACRCVNAPVVFLCFYFAVRLSLRSRAAYRIPCKRSFTGVNPLHIEQFWIYIIIYIFSYSSILVVQVSEVDLPGKKYFIQSISNLLMPWWQKEPRHQQA